MSKKILTFFILSFVLFFTGIPTAYAIDDPLSRPNNKIGIHILFTSELSSAAKLVNSTGGDWGYVTIPIQTKDRNKAKWQRFMLDAKRYHLIPILRLATEGDPATPTAWKKPQLSDILDLSQFLDTLDWPVKNRYIIVFNEVNRGDEWGGKANPAEYADILSFAVTVFKSKNPDYFIISSGLDNAAPNQGTNFINEYDFMRLMNDAVPGIFHQIDGLGSHSYPNPAFSQPPDAASNTGVGSFKFEQTFAQSLNGKTLPVFITETGWSTETTSDNTKIKYYQDTFNTIWNDPSIVAITPFLLDARGGPFQKFSFLTATGSATEQYTIVKNLPKTKGTPQMPVKVLAAETVKPQHSVFHTIPLKPSGFSFSNLFKTLLSL